MIRAWILLLAAVLWMPAKAQFKGRILIEGTQQGMASVRVSDGLNVTLTDAQGRYILPGHPKQRFVFITTPAGFRTTETFWQRVDSTRKEYDFTLRPMVQTGKFLRITDTETWRYDAWVTDLKEYVQTEGADFLVHTGDICYEKGMAFHADQVNTSTMGLPTYYCIGNHDLVKGPYGEALYESLFGPVFYSFDAGKVHYIVTPMLHGDYKPSYTADDVYQWLKNDLAKADPSKPVMIFSHDLLTYDSLFMYKDLNLNEHRLKAWIYGHWHINYARKHGNNGVLSICTAPAADGGIDNSACNFEVFQTDQSGITNIHKKYTYVHRNLVTRQTVQGGKRSLSVNAYHAAGTVEQVTARVFDKQGNQLQSLALKPVTDWNWRGELPAGAKDFTLTTEARLRGGEVIFKRDTLQNTTLQWTTNVKGNIWRSTPLLAEGKIFIGSIDDEYNHHSSISALDAATGKLLWQYPTGNSIKNILAYKNGLVIGTDAEGVTYALEAATGKLRWKHEGPMTSLPAYISGGIISGDTYYTGAAKFLEALNVNTGKPLWRNTAWGGGEGTTAVMAIQDTLLAVSSNWNALFMHQAATGKLLWKRSDGGIRFRSSPPVFADGRLYVCGINILHIIDPATGRTTDSILVPDGLKTMAAPVITDKLIIVSGAEKGLFAFHRNTLQPAWQFKPGEALFYSAPYSKPSSATIESTPLYHDGKIYAAALDGNVYVLDAATGKVLKHYALGSPVFGPVTREGDRIYLADFAGNVYAFKI
ncbi:PQQ-binding-like beta-propeller repeat protein [Chitinophaga barathri]|nr:PQQ-binding-like beta-propeller repeat protein [Chitinophaga barathri]